MALLDWLAGAAGTASDIMNYFNQTEALKWQKEAQNTTWAREDNAVQRRVADLKAAGLNPVLAAGSAAQTSGPITPQVPHMQVTGLDRAATMQQLRNNRNTQELITAQKYAAESAGDKARADADIAANDAKWRDQINNLSYVTAVRQAELLKQNINKVASEIVQTNQRTAEELYNWPHGFNIINN